MFGLSSVVGPTLGGFITDSLTWRWVFYINLPLGIPVVALFVWLFPNVRSNRGKRALDYGGMVSLILAVVPIVLGLSWAGAQYSWASPQVIGALSIGSVMAAVFVVQELRTPEPIMPLSIFRNPIVGMSMIAVFLSGMGMFGAIIFIPLYFQGVLGASATSSGSFLTPMMLGVVVGATSSGQALSRLGSHYRLQGLLGLAIMGTGSFLVSQMTGGTGYARAVANIVILGVGLGITLPTFTLAVQNAVPYRVMGVATASVQFFRTMGGTVGLAVLGSLMASRFASAVRSTVNFGPEDGVPPDVISQLMDNPRALVGEGAVERLQNSIAGVSPQGANLAEQIVTSLKSALASAIGDVFLVILVTVAVAFVATLFLRRMRRGGEVSAAV